MVEACLLPLVFVDDHVLGRPLRYSQSRTTMDDGSWSWSWSGRLDEVAGGRPISSRC